MADIFHLEAYFCLLYIQIEWPGALEWHTLLTVQFHARSKISAASLRLTWGAQEQISVDRGTSQGQWRKWQRAIKIRASVHALPQRYNDRAETAFKLPMIVFRYNTRADGIAWTARLWTHQCSALKASPKHWPLLPRFLSSCFPS